MRSEIIYDIGLHEGQDTEFYLKKGFRVVAIDANPAMVEKANIRFSHYVNEGKLILLNVGIVAEETQEKLTFYINTVNTEWSSFIPDVVYREGHTVETIQVPCATLSSVIKEYGCPYYVKIDIEGHDKIALQSIQDSNCRPKFISVENGNEGLLELLYDMGYHEFKYVQQNNVTSKVLTYPPKEGEYVCHSFPFGASGPFGEETQGPWKNKDEVRKEIEKVWNLETNKQQPGHRDAVDGWFDLHAKHSESQNGWEGPRWPKESNYPSESSSLILTVAICTYRRYNWLEKCLNNLKRSTLPLDKLSVIIVDNSLTPNKSKSFCDSLSEIPNLEYIITDKAGLSFARNVALERCETPLIAYLDDDALPDPEWAANLVTTFERYGSGVAIVGGKVDPIFENPVPDWLSGNLPFALTVIDWADHDILVDEAKWLVGANVAYRTDVLRRVGGFSTLLGRVKELPLCDEELEVNIKIKRLGYAAAYAPGVRVRHFVQAERMSQSWLIEQGFWEGVSKILLAAGLTEGLDIDAVSGPLQSRIRELMSELKPQADHTGVEGELYRFRIEGMRACSEVLGLNSVLDWRTMFDDWPVVYVTVPCGDDAQALESTLASLLEQEGGMNIRVHVVHQGQSEEVDLLLDNRIRVLSDFDHPDNPGNIVLTSVKSAQNDPDLVVKELQKLYSPERALNIVLPAGCTLENDAMASAMRLARELPKEAWFAGQYKIKQSAGDEGTEDSCFPHKLLRQGLCNGVAWPLLPSAASFWRRQLLRGFSLKHAGLPAPLEIKLWKHFSEKLGVVNIAKPFAMVPESYIAQVAAAQGHQAGKGLSKIQELLEKQGEALLKVRLISNWPDHDVKLKAADMICDNPLPAIKSGSKVMIQNTDEGKWVLPKPHQGPLGRLLDNLRRYLAERRLCRMIEASGLFFSSYYLAKYPDVAKAAMDPILHYVRHGHAEGRNPNPYFDSAWYLQTYQDVRESRLNPLCHYIEHGGKEGRATSPDFSGSAYFEAHPDVRDAQVNPLYHYLWHGLQEGRRPA